MSYSFQTHDKFLNSLMISEVSKEFRLTYGSVTSWSIIWNGVQPIVSDWYNVNKIIDLSLIENEVSKTKGNLGKILATGLLFGPVGAIAGSLGNSQKITNTIHYSVRFTLNDIKLAVVDLHCKNLETALRVINTIKLLKNDKKNQKITKK